MPLRFLRGSAVRFVLTAFALACGVALVCAIDLVNAAVLRSFTDVLDTMAGRAALHVSAGAGGLFPEDVTTTVARVPGVELAVPVVSASAFTTDAVAEHLAVHGVDVTNEAAVRSYEPAGETAPQLEDPLVFLSRPDSVLVTEEFARRRRLAAGDGIELDTPTGRRRFVVRGLLAPHGVARAYGGNLLVMDVAAAEAAFTRAGHVNRVDVVVARDADLDGVADAITAVLPPGLVVERPAQRKVNLHKVMQSGQLLAQAVGLLGLVAAFLIVFTRLTSVFEARTSALAVLRAVGVRARRVWLELAKESLVIAAAGIALGIPLGIGIADALMPVGETATALAAKLPPTKAVLVVRPGSLLLAAALGVLAVLSAAALPAWRAARISVGEALRRRGTEVESDGGVSWLVRGVVALLALTAVVAHMATGSAAVGLVTSALVVLLGALLGRPIVTAVASPLVARIAARRPTARMAMATVLRNPRRTALTVSTIGVGLGTVLWLWTLTRSFEQSLIDVMPGVLRGDLSVSSSNLATGYVEAPIDDDLLPELRRVPGVLAVVGEQVTDWRYGGGPIVVHAFDPDYFSATTFGRWPLVGRRLPNVWDAVGRGDAVIVSENFVRNLRVGVGDTIALDTPRGPLVLRIAGVTRNFLSPRGTVEISRTVYAREWNDEHIVRALVKLAPDAASDRVRADIARALGRRYSLQVTSLDVVIEWITSQVRRAFGPLLVLGGLVLLVVLLGLADALAASVLERTRDLGIVRAVGVRRVRLGGLVVFEAGVLTMLGLALALGIGLVLAVLWVGWTFPALLGWSLSLHVPAIELGAIAAVALVACLGAAIVPALRATALDPVDALRTD